MGPKRYGLASISSCKGAGELETTANSLIDELDTR